MMLTVEQADAYFSTHLDKAFWEGLTVDQRTGALSMAENDVCMKLGASAIVETNTNMVNAVYEQAVYLVRHHTKLSAFAEIEEESISGAGSRSYRKSVTDGFSPRALMFIRRAAGRSMIFNRG